MYKGSIILELSRSLALPRTREDTLTTTMEATLTMEGVHITTVALRMEMGMEEAASRTVPTQQHPLRRTSVMSPVISAGKLDTTPMIVLS